MIELLKLKGFYIVTLSFIVLIAISSNKISADQKIKIIADKMQVNKNDGIITASGNAIAQDEKGSIIKSDKIIYNENQSTIRAEGNIIFNDIEGNTYFIDRLKSDDEINRLEAIRVKARLDDNSRIVGSSLVKNDEISKIENAEYTPCLEDDYLIKNCPGWKLKAGSIYQDNETKTIHYDHARIHLFNIPVLYLPYFSHPDPSVKKRSGFLMPTFETDQNLGDAFSMPIFYNIKSNMDLTFVPTLQSKSNDFYSFNYRHLSNLGLFNIDTSIDDNDDGSGTSNHLFFDGDINNPYGSLKTFLQTSNNDTYMRKNKINKLTVLKSGINFERSTADSYLSIDTNSYKHLARQGQQWEYIYPRIVYNINNIEDQIIGGNINLNNQFSFNKDLNNSYSTLASSQINWHKNIIERNYGLAMENEVNFRIVSISIDSKTSEDTRNGRFYPQISSRISYPLIIAITALARFIILQGKEMDPAALVYEAVAIVLIAGAIVILRLRHSDKLGLKKKKSK